jgi:hypothetical protein
MNENFDTKEMWKARYEVANLDKLNQFETIVQLKIALDAAQAELEALKNDVSEEG